MEGGVPLALARLGIIRRVRNPAGQLASARSRRRARKSGELGIWELTDPVGAMQLAAQLAAATDANEPQQGNLFD